nr:hypothetical protein [Tanacetum cinerariifolium]
QCELHSSDISFLQQGELSLLVVGTSFGGGKSSLAVGMPCAFYSQQNVDYAYLMWEDFVYQVEHKNKKKSNEMYYPRFTKVIIYHFMSKDPSISRRNKFGALLPIELTNDEIKNSNAYKEYYAIATGEAAPKPKASVRRARRADEGTGSKPGVPDVPTDESEEELFWNSTDDEGDDNEEKDDDGDEEDEGDDGEDGDDDEDDDGEEGGDDDNDQEVERDDDKEDEEEGGDDEQEYDEEEYWATTEDNQRRGIQATLEVEDSHVTLTSVNPDGMESVFETTLQLDVQTPTSVTPLPMIAPTMTPPTIAIITTTSQALILPTTFAGAVSSILGIVNRYMDQRMNEAVKVAVQIQSDRLRDEAQRENDEFLRTVDENMKKIIKEQVKEQVKVQVSKILPRIEQAVNKQLEAKVLTRSSHSSKTSYAVDADLSEIELKKILIKKMEGNKSIQHSDEQRNLSKALVEAYESDKIILDTYGETVTLKRRRDDDADKDEEPSVGPDWGSKRRREGKEPESASAPSKTTTRRTGRSTKGSRSRQASTSESALAEEPVQTTFKMDEPSHLEFDKDYGHIKWIEDLVPRTMWIEEPIGYDKHALWRLQALGLDNGARDDDKLYKFKEGDFKRLRIQDIEDILLLLVQEKLTNLTVEECFAFNVSLRMFTRSIVIQRRVEDLQLGVESYQEKLNLMKPDSYRSDLKRKEAYNAYSNPRGFIYQNKDKKNRLMRIDELHKFSDGTLIDVRTALDDRLKGIQMQYLPHTIWRKSDKDRAVAMIQAIDKRLKTRRIMRSLERFVGGRLYEGDFRMLQRTI